MSGMRDSLWKRRCTAKGAQAGATTMLRRSLRAKTYLLVAALCVLSCAISGCVESSFTLSSESRMPACIALPSGLTRKDVSVTLNLSVPIRGDDVSFILKDRRGKELLEIKGRALESGGSLYFHVLTDKGTKDLIELRPYRPHENMEQNGRAVALFSVIDDTPGQIYR
jgi:hypothetical protein